MNGIVTAIILVATLINAAPFIYGILKTPPSLVFLGTIHYPVDYFYYLSQFAQGETNWLLSDYLYRSELYPKILAGWPHVFLGRLAWLLGIPHLVAYHAAVIAAVLLFLYLAYRLLGELFRQNKSQQILALLFFVTTAPFPRLINVSGKWQLSAFDFWYNLGNPFNRLGGVPYHLINYSVLVLALLLILWWQRRQTTKLQTLVAAGIAAVGLLVALFNPVQWLILTAVIFLTTLVFVASHRLTDFKVLSHRFRPALLLCLGGLPGVFYVWTIRLHPFLRRVIAWEATQQVDISVGHYLLANGPVALLAIVGLPLVLKTLTWGKLVALYYTAMTLLLFFSEVPQSFGLSNARVLSPLTNLFLAGLAAVAVWEIGKKLRLFARPTTGIIAAVVIVLGLPGLAIEFKQRIVYMTPNNAYYYLSRDALRFFEIAKRQSTPRNAFLVIGPYNTVFPGLTGRRSFDGQLAITPEEINRDQLAAAFFANQMPPEEMRQFLARSGISYVIAYPWTFNPIQTQFLSEIYATPAFALYRVVNKVN